MKEKKLTLALPMDMFSQVDAMCGKFEDYPSKQSYLFSLVENDLKSKGLLVDSTQNIGTTKIEEVCLTPIVGKTFSQRFDEKN